MPPEERHFWDDVDAHIHLLVKHGFDNSANMLRLYEAERKRQQTAINNLNDQLATLSERSCEQAYLAKILARGGFDLDTIIATDKALGGID